MKILITGGCGFIGTNVAIEAKKRGHEVIRFDSLIRPLSEENIGLVDAPLIRGDIRNPEDFERIPEVDAIINFAANPGVPWSINWPIYDFNVNAKGALNVLEFSKSRGKIPVIFASTNKVYSEEVNDIDMFEYDTRYEWLDKEYKGINEDFPMDSRGKYPHSPYGASKASADLYHQEYFHTYGIPVVINRMSCIYGKHQKGVADQGWIDHFVRVIKKGDGKIDIFGDGKQVRDMLWGGDVARLYLDELENIDKVKGEVFNVGGGIKNTISLIESINYIEKITNKKAELTYHDWRPADQKIYISDITKVKEKLGWEPEIDPEKGIFHMVFA